MSLQAKAPSGGQNKTLQLVVTAMFIVLVYVFTYIGFPLAILPGTYIHLGNIPLMMAALLFGRRCAALAGGLGMFLFDILSPYAAWAPFTLVIVACMGYLLGLLWEKGATLPRFFLGVVLAAAIKVGGYYMADAIIYGNWIMPVASIPANALQLVIAAAVVLPLKTPVTQAAAQILGKATKEEKPCTKS